jgi:hypothetical protein
MEVLMLDNGRMDINMDKGSILIQKEFFIKANGNKGKRVDMEK